MHLSLSFPCCLQLHLCFNVFLPLPFLLPPSFHLHLSLFLFLPLTVHLSEQVLLKGLIVRLGHYLNHADVLRQYVIPILLDLIKLEPDVHILLVFQLQALQDLWDNWLGNGLTLDKAAFLIDEDLAGQHPYDGLGGFEVLVDGLSEIFGVFSSDLQGEGLPEFHVLEDEF